MNKQWILGLAVVLAPVISAQEPRDTAEAGRLRTQIEQRFSERVQQELKLTPDQATKLRASQERFGTRRRALMQQQQARRRALEDQMQPGVAANSDSVRKLMDAMRDGRAEMLKIEREEDQEMAAYLNPVQRARYQHMRERFIQRVGEMRQMRREREGMGGRPGTRPGAPRRPRRGI